MKVLVGGRHFQPGEGPSRDLSVIVQLQSSRRFVSSSTIPRHLDEVAALLLGDLLPHVHHDVPQLGPGDVPVTVLPADISQWDYNLHTKISIQPELTLSNMVKASLMSCSSRSVSIWIVLNRINISYITFNRPWKPS